MPMILRTFFSVLFYIVFLQLGYAHAVAIDDSNFEEALVDLGHDIAVDGWIEDEITNEIFELDISGYEIEDMSSLQYFFKLRKLDCSNNSISSLDLSFNPYLQKLDCSNNELEELDLYFSTRLIHLDCSQNLLKELDFTRTLSLKTIDCSDNEISVLKNIEARVKLEKFVATNNQLTALDFSKAVVLNTIKVDKNLLKTINIQNENNAKVKVFSAKENKKLKCVRVDDKSYSKNNWKNSGVSKFSEKCK